MSFIKAFKKVAVDDLAESARITALAPMQSAVPGTDLRDKAETGQARSKVERTRDTDRNFAANRRTGWRNSRAP